MKGKEMRHFLIIMVLLPVLITGCTQYTRLEDVELGMPLDEFLLLESSCYYRSTSGDTVRYSCQFNAPAGKAISGRGIRPYLVTFENGILTQIDYDEAERIEQMLRRRYPPHYHYGYGAGTPFYDYWGYYGYRTRAYYCY